MWDKKLCCGSVRDKNFCFYLVLCLQFVMSLKQFYKSNTVQTWVILSFIFLANQTHSIKLKLSLERNAHLIRAALVKWAVILVYYNGVLNFNHCCMYKMNMSYKSTARLPPWFYSKAILSLRECSWFDCHVLNTRFIQFPS